MDKEEFAIHNSGRERPETAKAVSRFKERKQMGMGYLNETKYYQMNDNEEPL